MAENAGNPAAEPGTHGALNDLVEELLERYEREGEGAVEQLCQRRPDLASALRRRIEHLRAMGLLEAPPPDAEPGPTAGPPDPLAGVPERLGDFRLLERLGGGGMGIVYLAEQESLGRKVALKLVRPDLLYFPGAKERFQREAEAVARLSHSAIIPIYTIGTQGDLPYFAMEHVVGASLAQVVERLKGRDPEVLTGRDMAEALAEAVPGSRERILALDFGKSWVEACFRVILPIAHALAHAHERGVLHRDLKPSNVMLAPDGRSLLLDFGLATLRGSARLTRTGSNIGSLAYMAPEQVRGLEVDERSDVYALGVTLFELLSLRLPFLEDHTDLLQMRILRGDAEGLRRLNPSVPWDAETVCSKAMELEPRRRYASAAAFARDLANVLELRPIEAARPGAVRRATRFAQRRPALAVALALGSLLVLGGPITFGVLQRNARLAIDRERAVVLLERERAERNLARSFEAVDRMLTRLGVADLAEVPHLAAVRRSVLQDALAIFEGFVRDQAGHPGAEAELAAGYRRVAEIEIELGEIDPAFAALERSIEILERLRSGTADRSHLDHELAQALASRAVGRHRRGSTALALEDARRALQLLQRLHAADSADAAVLETFALTTSALCSYEHAAGNLAEAERAGALAADLLEDAVNAGPEAARLGERLVATLSNLAIVQGDRGDVEAALRTLERAAALAERALETAPTAPFLREALAAIHLNRAQFRRAQGGTAAIEQAATEQRRGLELLDGVVRDFPERLAARIQLAQATTLHAESLGMLQRDDAAEAEFRRAVELWRERVRADPEGADSPARLASAIGGLGDVLSRSARLGEARDAYREAIGILTGLRSGARGESVERNLTYDHGALATVLAADGDFDGALAAAEAAAAALARWEQRAAKPEDARAARSEIERQICDLLLVLGRPRDAVERAVAAAKSGDPALHLAAARVAAAAAGSADATEDQVAWSEVACRHLERAIEGGATTAAAAAADPELAPLQESPCFRARVEAR